MCKLEDPLDKSSHFTKVGFSSRSTFKILFYIMLVQRPFVLIIKVRSTRRNCTLWFKNYIIFQCNPLRHSCQNPDLDPTILRFYDLTYPKRSKSFKDLCGHSGSVGSYDSDDPKQSWFLVILFNLIKGSVGPKWKIKS